MLNTGLSLRRPHESSYGAYHRFLIANAGYSASNVNKALRNLQVSNDTKLIKQYVLAQRHEAHFCKLNHIPYISPLELEPGKVRTRHCPICAATGYHSPVFQWNWLSHCPIHHTPLTSHCQICQQPWPTLGNLNRRRCGACGWPIHIKSLVANFAFDAAYDSIGQLKAMESAFNSLRCVELVPPYSAKYLLDSRPPMTIGHQHFPSIFAKIFPSYRMSLIEKNVQLQKVYKRSFNRAITTSTCSRTFLQDAQKRIQEIVSARIIATIANERHRPLVIPDRFSIDFEGIDENRDCYLFAYLYRQKLVNECPYAGIHRNHYSRYFDSPLQKFPLIPTPPSRVKFSQRKPSDAENWNDGLAPLNLTLLILELDLWWCYKSLLKYFDTLKAHRGDVAWGHFYDSLPEWAWPGCNYNDNFLIVSNDDSVFDLYLPAIVAKPTFTDPDLTE